MMRNRLAWILAAALTAYVPITLSQSQATAETGPKGTFRQAYNVGSGALSSLDPISKGRVLQVTEKIMSRLVRPGPDGVPAPDLATEWSVNADGTEWTFHLRAGVTFHDGSPFDAEDVIYTLNRVLDPERDSPVRPVIAMIDRITAPDPLTVKMHLSSRFADLPLQLMDYRLRMIPTGAGDSIAQTGIGTGPFKVEKFDPDGITTLSAFADYWEGPPKLAEIEIIGIPDGQARLQAFLGGQIDMDRSVAPQLKDALARSGNYVVQEIPTGNWSGIAIRTDLPPFDDVRVRRAFRKAVDREELLKLAVDGLGVISCDTPVAPHDQYRAQMECPQDIDAAKALLAEAGYPDGVDVNVVIANLDPSWQPMAVALQAQLAKAGIRIKVEQAVGDGYWSEVWGKKPLCATSWGERPADQILNESFLSTAKWNETKFKDPTFDGLLAQARNELDFDRRRALYIAAQEYLADHSGTLIPFHVSQTVGLSKRVQNLPPVKNDAIHWNEVSIRTN